MKICFLINELAPAGAQTLLLDIVRNTDADDIEYTVCFIEGDDSLVSDFENMGARVVNFDATFKFDLRALWRLYRFFQHEEFDILHAHLPYSQILGRVFGNLGDSQNIVSTQHSAPNNYHPVTRILERITRSLDSRTIAVSKAVERLFTGDAQEYEPEQTQQWCTIHNGIDVDEFGSAVRAAETNDIYSEFEIGDGPVFVNVGRYFPQKSQHTLIKAMGHVVDELPEAQLLVVGWGELEDNLRATVRKHDLCDTVHITSRVPSIHPFYKISDCFVLSSVRESFGIVLLEAMAAKLPVVATDVQGIPEIVKHEQTGLLVPPRTPVALADAMVQSITSDNDYGANGHERAASAFDIQETVSSHIRLYRELCCNISKSSDDR